MTVLATDQFSTAGDLGSVIGGIIAALTLIGAARGIWRRTLGRRRDTARRLQRLGVGAQLGFYESVLGEPAAKVDRLDLDGETAEEPVRSPWRRRVVRALRPKQAAYLDAIEEPYRLPTIDLHTWMWPDCYVQAYVDTDTNTVVGFSVTQRSRRFKPTFKFPPNSGGWRFGRYGQKPFFKVKLGKTYLGEFFDGTAPTAFRSWVTPRNWFYADLHFLGNVGYYLCFVTASSLVGAPRAAGDITAVAEATEHRWGAIPAYSENSEWDDGSAVQKFRKATTITTYAVMSDQTLAEHIEWWGPHGDEVRTLLQPLY